MDNMEKIDIDEAINKEKINVFDINEQMEYLGNQLKQAYQRLNELRRAKSMAETIPQKEEEAKGKPAKTSG